MNSVLAREPLPASACGNLKLQRLILRVIVALSMVVVPAVILPGVAAEKLYWMLGAGNPPHSPLLIYLLGGGCCVYLAVVALLWVISGDVVRYRPLVIFVGWIYLVSAPILLAVALQAGMPAWWIVMDLLSCLISGAGLLWACYAGGAE